MGKIKETRQLYKEILGELSKSTKNWTEFLDSSSWNFKYDFDDQILIYAQRPDAKACATMEEWNNKLKRWVKGGTKPIYIFDKNPYSEYPFKLVFDLSDTHNYNNTEYKLWSIKKEYEEDIIDSLEASFGDMTSKENLSQAIVLASYNMVVDNMEDYLTSVINHKSNSMLENMSDEEIKNIFMTTAWASVSYMIMTRCGINAKEQMEEQNLSYISYFNNQEILTTLGASVSDIAEMGLREIAKTVTILQKKENLKNRTFEKNNNEMYDKDNEKIKGGIENGREDRIHETGRVLYAEPNNEQREDTTRQILSNEIQLSKEPQEARIDNISDGAEIDGTLDGNTGTSNTESREDNRGNEETRGNNGRTESSRPNEMGRTHEQHQDESRGDSSEGTDIHLEEITSHREILTEERKTNKDFLQDKYVSALLNNTKHLKVSRNDIKEFYKTHLNIDDRTEYIKKAFNDDYTEIIVDDVRLGYKTYQNLLHLWKDDYLNRTAEVYYNWNIVAEYIEGLIMVNEFNDLHKPVPSYDDQMQILQVEAENAPTFSFSQEIIDYALQKGSNISESKMRIYNQFEKSLSSQENVKFLKNEYGWGGSSSIHIGTRVGIDYDGKGIKLSRGYNDDDPKIIISWNNVAKRIEELIKADRYLNSKEKEEYPNWLKRQEQERELREAEKKLENQAKKQEDELAERVFAFVKPYEIYNYAFDSKVENTDEENIEIVKADINDSVNVIDYVNALKNIIEKMEDTNPQKHEAKVILSILEKRVPNYEYHLGDKVYIGTNEYEIAAINDDSVTLYDVKFPLLNKQMDFKEFEMKVRDNYANDHLKVENNDITLLKNETLLENKQEIIADMLNIKQLLKDLVNAKNNRDYPKNIQLKKEVEDVYDGFIDKYGNLVTEENKRILDDKEAFELFSLIEEHDIETGKIERGLNFPSEYYELGETIKLEKNSDNKYEIIEINLHNRVVIVKDIQTESLREIPMEDFDQLYFSNHWNKITYEEKNKEQINSEKQTEQQQEEKQEIKEEKPYKVGQEVYLESDRKYKIDEIDLKNEKISLLDLQINYPIFREESILTFENLYYQNERNQPKENIKPNFVKTSNKIQDFILHPEVALKDRNNYKIKDNNLGIGTPREKFERNIQAIKVLKKCEQENRYATPEEQEILSKYIGWGGLPQAFEENNSSWSNEYKILKDLLNEEEYKNTRSSTLTAFYTPPIVINAMYEILQNMGLKEANILEPSCRSWKFFRYATK